MALLGVMAGGATLASSCTVRDFRNSLISGTQSFVKGYATDLLGVFIPSANDIFGNNN